AALGAEPRSRDAALAHGVALVLQPWRRLHGGASLLPRARLGGAAGGLDRRHRPRLARAAALAGVGLARGGGFPRRLPDRPERAGVERDRRRLLRPPRRRADRARAGAVGPLPRRGRLEGVRKARRSRRDSRAHPAERSL